MRLISRCFKPVVIAMMGIMVGTGLCHAQITPDQVAPVFSLKDIKGEIYDLSTMKKNLMIILYFFDVDSRPSLEGLIDLKSQTVCRSTAKTVDQGMNKF